MSDDFIHGIVRILDASKGIAGTGFVVSEDGLIITCAHVIGTSRPRRKLTLVFHSINILKKATVISEGWYPTEDIAILQIEGGLPAGASVLPLGSSIGTRGHEIQTFGFPAMGKIVGIGGDGNVVRSDPSQEGRRLLQIRSGEIAKGFSGAPVWDSLRRRVIGIVSDIAKPDDNIRYIDTAFAIPTETLRAIYPVLSISDVCPYRGLEIFTEDDHEFFFGREHAVNRLIGKLRGGSHFVAVLGPSGSGKSSLVQAGLIVQLRKGAVLGSASWEFIISRPANDPFVQLTVQGLAGTSNNLLERVQTWRGQHPEKGQRLVLIIDQFEELWTTCPKALAQEFVTQLTQLFKAPYHEYITTIVIMRDDFYSSSVQDEQFADLMERGTVNTASKLRQEEFVDIIQKPASAVGLRFADGLVHTIVEDALGTVTTPLGEERQGPSTALPLLEFALTELWNRRQDGELTHDAYIAIHGVSGTIAQWAENTFYNRIEERLQPLARHIFTKLVYLGNEKQGLPRSRRRRTLDSLCPVSSNLNDVHQVVHQLAKDRLLVTSRDGGQEWVEIIHDVLLREWDLLSQWIAEDNSFLIWYQEFERRVQLWIETDPNDLLLRDEGRLLRGRDLDDAEHWMAERSINFDPIEQDFIKISRKQVERQRQELTARQLAAQAELVQNQKTHFLQRSMLLAVEAMLHFPCLEADQALRSRLAFFPRPITYVHHNQRRVHAVAFSPNGRYLATAGQDRTACVWEVASGQKIVGVKHGNYVNGVTFSPDGRYVASADDDGKALVWEVVSKKSVALMTHEGSVEAVVFSPDGLYLATASRDRTARVWKATSGEEVVRLTHDGFVNTVMFSPDGRYLATGSNDGTSQVWDTVSHEVIDHIKLGEIVNDHEKQALKAVAFSPDGRYLAVGGREDVLDGVVMIWETSSRSEVKRIKFKGVDGLSATHQAAVNALAFSPDSASLVTANEDWMAHLCEVATGRQLQRFTHEGFYLDKNAVNAVAFSPDGRYLATASGDGTAGIWETHSGRQIACLTGGIILHAVMFSPDGHYLVTAGNDAARIWEMPGKSRFVCLNHDGPVYAVAASPDGRYLATGSQDRTAQLWKSMNDQKKGEKTTVKSQLEASLPHRAYVIALAFSVDGRYLATASADHTVGLWQLPRGSLIHRLMHKEEVVDVVFSSDNRYLATASSDHTAGVWETASGQQCFRLEHKEAVTAVAFSPNGMYLATVSEDRTAKIWQMTSGQCKAHLIHDYLEDTRAPGATLRDTTFSPDGRYLATAGGAFLEPGVATLWNVSDGSKIAHLTHRYEIRMVAFSPDGCYLATASDDWKAGIWEVSSGRRLASLAHEKDVHAVAFSHDGNYLATASWDGTAGIWEVPSGRQLARMTHESRVYAAIFSSDDKYVITASEDGTAQVWLWKPQDMINEASSRLTYDLTPEEWRVYMGEEPYRKTRYCPLQEQPKVEENGAEATEEANMGSGNDEIGLFVAQIRRGHPTRAGVEYLKQYGVACLERLIKQTKKIRGGDSGAARDEVFAGMNAEDAFPTVMPLIQNNDRNIRQLAALSLCRFRYQDVHKIGNAIGAIGYVLRWAEHDDSSETDKWRLREAIDILDERRETEFNEDGENQVQVSDVQTIKSNEENLSKYMQVRPGFVQPESDSALLTEQAKQAILFAEKEARNFQHNYIGTEHLLLGLLDELEGGAAKLLNEVGVEPEKVRSALEFIISRGGQEVSREIGLTPRVKKVLELASNEARRLNHQSLSTEHLLLGLLHEGEDIAAGILESLGINLEQVRHKTITRLSQHGTDSHH